MAREDSGHPTFTIRAAPSGGSKLTADCAAKHCTPSLHLARQVPGDPAARLRQFLTTHAIKVLKVAGSRASKEPDAANFVAQVLTLALTT